MNITNGTYKHKNILVHTAYLKCALAAIFSEISIPISLDAYGRRALPNPPNKHVHLVLSVSDQVKNNIAV